MHVDSMVEHVLRGVAPDTIVETLLDENSFLEQKVNWSFTDGIGVVPDQSLDEMGIRTEMTPREFLQIAAPLDSPMEKNIDFLKEAMRNSETIGAPFLEATPQTHSGIRGYDAIESGEPWFWQATQHEGRHRMLAAQEIDPMMRVPVSILWPRSLRTSDFEEKHLRKARDGNIRPETRGR